MFSLRWEVVPLHRPWSAPEATVLLPPIASGTITREEMDPTTNERIIDPASPAYATSEIITVPQAPEGAPWLLLAVEAFGSLNWLVRIGDAGSPPAPITSNVLPEADPYPGFVVPAATITKMEAVYRSREVRAVKAGSIFIAKPVATPWR